MPLLSSVGTRRLAFFWSTHVEPRHIFSLERKTELACAWFQQRERNGRMLPVKILGRWQCPCLHTTWSHCAELCRQQRDNFLERQQRQTLSQERKVSNTEGRDMVLQRRCALNIWHWRLWQEPQGKKSVNMAGALCCTV